MNTAHLFAKCKFLTEITVWGRRGGSRKVPKLFKFKGSFKHLSRFIKGPRLNNDECGWKREEVMENEMKM